jgi:hypothetical protein
VFYQRFDSLKYSLITDIKGKRGNKAELFVHRS